MSPYYPGLEPTTSATKWITNPPPGRRSTGRPHRGPNRARTWRVPGGRARSLSVVVSRRNRRLGVCSQPRVLRIRLPVCLRDHRVLAFAVGAVYFLFVSVDDPRPKIGRSFVLALGSILAVVLSHHVTGWLTVGFLVVWFEPAAHVLPLAQKDRTARGLGDGRRPASSASRLPLVSSSAVPGPGTWVAPQALSRPALLECGGRAERGAGKRSGEPDTFQIVLRRSCTALGHRIDPGGHRGPASGSRSLPLQRRLQLKPCVADCSATSQS